MLRCQGAPKIRTLGVGHLWETFDGNPSESDINTISFLNASKWITTSFSLVYGGVCSKCGLESGAL